MRKALEGSQAIAQAVALCRPQVIAAYPITRRPTSSRTSPSWSPTAS
jgi:pyruvate/2-oxoacid:ferredoxin oxidoreductase alpha subunit